METKKIRAKHREVRLVFVTDPHMTIMNPISYKMNYWDILKDTFAQLTRFAISREVDAIIWGGDLFHLKASARNPLSFVAETCDIFAHWSRDLKIPQIGIAGNHDLKFGHLNGLEGQPLEVLTRAQLYTLLDRTELLIEGYDFTTRVAGTSFHHGTADGARDKKKDGATYLLSVGHFWFGTQTGELFGEKIYSPEFLGSGEPDVYLIGHHHADQGVQRIQDKYYVAHGSITRTGSHELDLTRKPAASYLTITREELKIKILRPAVPEGTDIIDTEKRTAQRQEEKEMNEFIESLRETELESLDPKEILDQYETTQEVRKKTREYLEQAEGKQR